MRGIRRTATLALVLALAVPAQLPALAQGVDAQGVEVQKGRDVADAPRTDNKAEAAAPPIQPTEGSAATAAKVDDKGTGARTDTGAPHAGATDPGAPDTGAPGADAADAATAADPSTAGAAGADVAAVAPAPDDKPSDQPSGVAAQLAGWVTSTSDNGDKPFAIVDKLAARIFVFGADGGLIGAAPVLVGLAHGDDSAAGIGDRALSAIGPDERTTPAGRFVARFGPASGNKTVLWVDYADAISMHPVVTTNPKEHRLRRIKSDAAEDHRISYGCINVPARFYERVVLKAFRSGGGIVYILPDTRPLEDVFPAFAVTVQASAADAHAEQAAADQAAQRYPTFDALAVDPSAPEDQTRDDSDAAIATQHLQQPAAEAPKRHRRSKASYANRTLAASPR
jgi:hypothetical protein